MTARLEALGVSKTFGSTTVLDEGYLVVEPGEIHALVGQNGSGKSTLVKILTGYHAPDPGASLSVDGQPLALPVQWRSAQTAGVSVVHQDMGLLDHLTVSENIGVGGFAHHGLTRKIDWKRQDEVARRTLERLEIPVDVHALVGSLPGAHRAGVAIARALRDQVAGEGVMILDEATRSLPRDELARFHTLLRRIVASGTSVIMVSHNLEEVLSVSDRVTVLRDGKVAGGGLETRAHSERDLARLMLGKNVDSLAGRRSQVQAGTVAAKVEGLTLDGFAPFDLEIAKGEVVGITGLPGTGFEQVPYAIAGATRPAAGRLTTESGSLNLAKAHVSQTMKAGVALVPERRDREGLAVDLSVRDNLVLPSLRRRGKPWHVGRGWQHSITNDFIDKLGIRARSGEDLVRELSGGNQQKVLFAKWLSLAPNVLVLHEPTQAVDVGARADLLNAIGAAAAAGAGVVLVSTEPSDLAESADRVLVLHPGVPARELVTTNPDDILNAIYSEATTTAGGPHA
ncbi:sugar ABC transporter ATP-binding protein [Nocardioides sp. cx-173]|uniref:sugar ABC transporter ATP-binding protein n=1 Tax=Nocardioides sp. cx-173 TaxID=2898796 RepID=UPI001E4F091D|nr:sugar ABC transporter ATP-binding protein [Nocardioides sp. cx-173]MCD4526619.1 sugar ABC transporter ATP-binding protein [Nocardioides sp. cx-173]UGB40712.1 sugar ABC transporter ATP-binding protein [Nocardioides sp. cx-173]